LSLCSCGSEGTESILAPHLPTPAPRGIIGRFRGGLRHKPRHKPDSRRERVLLLWHGLTLPRAYTWQQIARRAIVRAFMARLAKDKPEPQNLRRMPPIPEIFPQWDS
jgi:hypothetical protein